jgi:hypothetical protein
MRPDIHDGWKVLRAYQVNSNATCQMYWLGIPPIIEKGSRQTSFRAEKEDN